MNPTIHPCWCRTPLKSKEESQNATNRKSGTSMGHTINSIGLSLACLTHALQDETRLGDRSLYSPAIILCPAAKSGRPLPPIQPILPLLDITWDIMASSSSGVLLRKPRGTSIRKRSFSAYSVMFQRNEKSLSCFTRMPLILVPSSPRS